MTLLRVVLTWLLIFTSAQETQVARIPGPGGKAPASSGPTFDAEANATAIVSGTTISWTHTLASGAHPAIFVMVMGDQAPSSCTAGGSAMTQIFTKQDGNPVGTVKGFIVTGSTSGSVSMSCTYAAAVGVGAAASLSWLGVNQSTPNRTCTTANDGGIASTPATVTASNAVSGDGMVDGAFSWKSGGSVTMTSTQTAQYNGNGLAGTAFSAASSSATASGSTVMSYTLSASAFWAIGACPLIGG